MRRFKHLSPTDRIRIEEKIKAKKTPREIADEIGVHISTIYRELKRGQYEHLNSDYTTEVRYSPDIAQERYERNLEAKGAPLKIGSDFELAQYIEDKITREKYSPAAVLGEIKAQGIQFQTTICTTTLYSYITKGVFLTLTNKHLPVKGSRKRKYRHIKKISRPPRGESIEKRPEEIENRETFGNWEMDCVEGGKKGSKETLLVLTERMTRQEIIIKMPDKTAPSVVKALNRLERKYGALFPQIFRTITVDNGSEFADCAGMERSRTGKGKRTKVYYCHPYSSWERGSNENQNKMIRRHFPKGFDFRKATAAAIRDVENWINNYPRAIFNFLSSAALFQEQLEALGAL